jgi:diguanylate cyclase (GGDEF)-like protein/PAS domain S-box-containing protein
MMNGFRTLTVLVLLTLSTVVAVADTLTLGVFAYRPKEILEQRFQPLADYLSTQLPGNRIILQVLTQAEMEQAVARNELDLVFTNPSHYVLLRSRSRFTGALVTLVSKESGRAANTLGGVIIARADDNRFTHLSDLKGHRIGVPGKKFLGGFQTQAYELLQADIHLPDDSPLEVLDTHDAVVMAVLSGQINVGFIRTGVIEEMTREGKLDPAQLRIVNEQQPPGFPYRVSTRLYPEWAFIASPDVDSRIIRRVASSLLALEEDHPVALAAGIGGFSPPGDYLPVENLARALRLPPFDQPPTFTLREVWERWLWLWLSLISVIGMTLLLAVFRLASRNRELVRLEQERALTGQAIRESEQHFRTLANNGSALIWTSGLDRGCDYFNEPWLAFTGRTLEQSVGNGWMASVHADDLRHYLETYHQAFDRREAFGMEYRLRHADGDYRWVWIEASVRYDSANRFIGYIGFCYDITHRKQAGERIQLAAKVFTSAREGIMITDPQGHIIEVNQAFTDITGYRLDEVIGRGASLLKSGRQSAEFYAEFWHSLIDSGHWSGEIWNRRRNGEVYAEYLTISAVRDSRGQIQHYAALFSDITPQKEHQFQLERIAHYDVLTGLPNRVLLADRLHQAMAQVKRHGRKLAVALIDLDGFKAINDQNGHNAGDELLIAIARRMHDSLREGDTIARIGGDEFVAVLVDLEESHASLPMILRLLTATAEPVNVDERVLHVSSSIGFTFYPQAEEIEPDQLLRQADQAMYQAKLAGKNRYQVFDAEMDRHVRSRHESVEAIRRGLERNEFVLFYQPKVNLRQGSVIGAEALIRWQHPQRGLLPPAEFLHVIEHHPLGIQLGNWVLDTALSQIETWRAQGNPLPVSVNISALHLQQPDFIARLQDLLARHPGVPAGFLELEVLETSALEDIGHVSEIIKTCVRIGVGFALDDFGTGYSSLTYLKHLPAAVLKIDQSFVRDMLQDPEDLAILEGVLGLAYAFRRRIIAEGVETEAHGEMLLQLGCDLAQGYGIALPMAAESIHGWITDWQPPPGWSGIAQLTSKGLPVLYAGVEHRAWVLAMDNFLAGKSDAAPNLEPNPSRFGQWLEKIRVHQEAPLASSFATIDMLHRQLHDLGNELHRLHASGNSEETRPGQIALHALSKRLLAALQALLDESNRLDTGLVQPE